MSGASRESDARLGLHLAQRPRHARLALHEPVPHRIEPPLPLALAVLLLHALRIEERPDHQISNHPHAVERRVRLIEQALLLDRLVGPVLRGQLEDALPQPDRRIQSTVQLFLAEVEPGL